MKFSKDYTYHTPQVTINFKAGGTVPAKYADAAKTAGVVEEEKANGDGTANKRSQKASGKAEN